LASGSVFEVRESREAQSTSMNGRLGCALQEAGIDAPPSRAQCLDLAAYRSL
jgi:hypothetical protein